LPLLRVVVVCVAVGATAVVDSCVVVVLDVGVGFCTVVQETIPKMLKQVKAVMLISFFIVGCFCEIGS
jgi:hypothetical protein